ncbi:unnamed protein product [Arabis nemorensis]|uniref:Uncharacterized protein n=1 Tax=Arabis nemorensis TaxID=586526 RepID=A0A565AYQ9_9BRAS|nr:unnamed protein product [Arabis nemorensis]
MITCDYSARSFKKICESCLLVPMLEGNAVWRELWNAERAAAQSNVVADALVTIVEAGGDVQEWYYRVQVAIATAIHKHHQLTEPPIPRFVLPSGRST